MKYDPPTWPSDAFHDEIQTQLAALDAGPKPRFRRFVALEQVCARCSEPVFRVVKTHPFWVLAGRDLDRFHRRTTHWSFVALDFLESLAEGRDGGLVFACKCHQWAVPAAGVLADLAEGHVRSSVAVRRSDDRGTSAD